MALSSESETFLFQVVQIPGEQFHFFEVFFHGFSLMQSATTGE